MAQADHEHLRVRSYKEKDKIKHAAVAGDAERNISDIVNCP
jgi:hypothetical protein